LPGNFRKFPETLKLVLCKISGNFVNYPEIFSKMFPETTGCTPPCALMDGHRIFFHIRIPDSLNRNPVLSGYFFISDDEALIPSGCKSPSKRPALPERNECVDTSGVFDGLHKLEFNTCREIITA
jgi:hypothetical protein